MNIRPKLERATLVLIAVTTLLVSTSTTWAQADTTPKKRLRSPAVASGFVGGEAHDSYVIRVRRGRTMTVQINWRRKDDNKAEFTVSESANFFEGAQVAFGTESNQGKRWSGRAPQTGNYYIYVVAHPTAHYTLRVRVRQR